MPRRDYRKPPRRRRRKSRGTDLMSSSTFDPLARTLGVVLLLAPGFVRADEADIAKGLKELGGEVTRTKGVVTSVSFRDCSKLGGDEFRRIGQLAH